MSSITLKKIISCSSEDQVHCATNLLELDDNKNWLSSKNTDEQIICILEFDKPYSISSLDIGNNGSAFIELFVGQSSEEWHLLLPMTSLMSPSDSRANINRCQVKSLKSFHLNKTCLNKKWTYMKIICDQKFTHLNQFGLNFIKLYSNENHSKEVTSIEMKDEKQIMKNISFVLSGFQNPLRTELREKATSMGAIYNEDWNETCTHLIYAFSNTPKLAQVQQIGKCLIVTHQWILDCYKQNKLLSEQSYQLKDGKTSTSKRKNNTENKRQKKSSNNKLEQFIELPDFFHDKHFYVSYGDYDNHTLLDITRIILAYDGIIEKQITSVVSYLITNRMWNQDFEKISKLHPNIKFVTLDWLQDCHNRNQFASLQSYLILP